MCNKVIDVTYVSALGNIMYVNDTVELCECLYKTKINRLYLINKYFNFTYAVLRRETPIFLTALSQLDVAVDSCLKPLNGIGWLNLA